MHGMPRMHAHFFPKRFVSSENKGLKIQLPKPPNKVSIFSPTQFWRGRKSFLHNRGEPIIAEPSGHTYAVYTTNLFLVKLVGVRSTRQHKAWGVPQERKKNYLPPAKPASTLDVTLVVFNSISLQELNKLILKRKLPVMVLLSRNVSAYFVYV